MATLAETLKTVIAESERGLATRICEHTTLNKTEISLWQSGERGLPAHKLVEAIDYLIDIGVIVTSLEIVKHG